jgi:hypothetical protein
MLPINLKKGSHYSAFEPEGDTWFDVEVEKFANQSEIIRSNMEKSFVKSSQDDTQPKVFAIDATWVAAWQEYHRGQN